MAETRFSLKKDVELHCTDQDIFFRQFFEEYHLGPLEPSLAQVLQAMSERELSQPEIRDIMTGIDGGKGLFNFFRIFGQMNQKGYICQTLYDGDRRLATLVPVAAYFQAYTGDVVMDKQYVLSRFACIRKDAPQGHDIGYIASNTMIVECPLGYARILLHHPQMLMVIALLAEPQSCQDLCAASSLPANVIERFVRFLLSINALSGLDEKGQPQENSDAALLPWDFHNLLFHTRTRYGRYDRPFIGQMRFAGLIEIPPAVKPAMSSEVIPLYKPDIEALKREDVSFTKVHEDRRSLYDFGEHPLTAKQLGEYLYRVGRVKSVETAEFTDLRGFKSNMEFTTRPYPGGGKLYELELYITVGACEGIDQGLYHYCPKNHHLEKLSDLTPAAKMMLNNTAAAMRDGKRPNVLITLAARYARIAWKYNTISYALIQKDVGVLSQSMYLVGEAMGLAPCMIGCNNSDLFAQATGLDYYTEGSVGEFAISSKLRL